MPFMDQILLIIGAILVLTGFLGCVIPVIPGPPLSYAGIILLHFSKYAEFSYAFLIIFFIITLIASTADNILPALGTKKFGGSKRAVWGAVIGLIAGIFFFPPLGIVIGPFIGALIFELTTGKEFIKAVKSSFGSFLGFITGMLLKVIASGLMLFYFVKALLASSKGTIV